MVEDYALSLGISMLLVNAAPDAMGFYDALGWERFTWNPAELVGIAAVYVQKRKTLFSYGNAFRRPPQPHRSEATYAAQRQKRFMEGRSGAVGEDCRP